MKCLVPVKRVIDYRVQIRVKPDNSGVETQHVKMSMDPFDEIAMEEAVKLKEAGKVTEIIAVTVGEAACSETLRMALARGADKAILVETDKHCVPLTIAKVLQKIIERETPELVLLGKQSIDGDNNQTGQMLAGLLDWPQGTFASKIEIDNDNVLVTREIDGGLETLKLKIPCVLTTDLRLNEPRYVSLPNVMKAKSKPMETIEFSSMDVEHKVHVKTLKVEPPETRKAGVKVDSVDELIDKLKNEAKVI